MTVKMLSDQLDLQVVAGQEGLNKEVKNAFVGDLLSLVMAHAKESDVWITVQGDVNSVAVAVLVNIPAIILTQGIVADKNMKQKADEEGIVILTTAKSSFEVAKALTIVLP